MKYFYRFALICILLGSISGKTYSQLSVSYYSSSLSKLGIGYGFNGRLWTELRVYTNTIYDAITPELVICYNIVKKDNYNVYLGVGGNYNYLSSVVFPIGVQFIPFPQWDRFSLHIELMPSFSFDEQQILQGAWGLRYAFGSRK